MSDSEGSIDDDDLAARLETVGEYKHGSIRSITLTNFLTYNDATIIPGPRLNVVVGPNGTGKSTILCAICLGLGGEPRLLERANSIETFIANGHDEGMIEVEIENSKGANPKVQRKLQRNGSPKSRFLWNGTITKASEVKKRCLEEYNIVTDNLCTFLPQDKVGNFSGFDSKQLLIETEKSLSGSDQELWMTHQRLIEMQEEMKDGTNNVDAMRHKLEQLKAENARLEREKERMEERERAIEQTKLLKQKLCWLQFETRQPLAMELFNQKAALKTEVTDARARIQPVQTKYDEKHQELLTLQRDVKINDDAIKKHKDEMTKQGQKYSTHDDKIEEILADLRVMDSRRGQVQHKVDLAKQKLEEYDAQLADLPTKDTVHDEEKKAKANYMAARPDSDNARRKLQQLEANLEAVGSERKRVFEKSKRLEDDKAQRQDRIFRQQPELQKISNWIQNHASDFRKEVVGPIVCEMTPKDKYAAAFLESHIPNSTLKSFVVQCKEDYDFLYKSIRVGLKIPINVMIVARVPPAGKRMYSDRKMKTLKDQYGVLGYMDESFSAPPLVVQALRDTAKITKVLMGSHKTHSCLDNENLLDFLAKPENGDRLQSCCICAPDKAGGNFKYQSNISRYSGKPSLRVDDVKQAKWLAPGVSDELKNKLREEKAKCDAEFKEISGSVEEAREISAETQEKAQRLKEIAKEKKENVTNLTRMLSKKSTAERKLKDALEELEVDDEDEKKKNVVKLKKRIEASLVALKSQGASYGLMIQSTVKASGAKLNKERVSVEERSCRHELDQAKESLTGLEQQFKEITEQFKSTKNELRRLKSEATRFGPVEDEQGNDLPLKALLAGLPVETVEECEDAVEDSERKANSILGNPDVVRQYNEKRQQVEDITAELDDLTNSKQKRLNELTLAAKPWQQKLETSVGKVDKLFSQYMNELGCTGEIALTTGENTSEQNEDAFGQFKDWGVEIKVSFRDGMKPAVLSAKRHSGGERSVSTIMYLMALQDMMVSPFRCVDEINQGLDDRNERLVFRRIVQNSCKPPGPDGPTHHAGQYFLITPKLLPNLNDMEDEAVTILFIMNGSHNFKSPTDWDVEKFIACRKRALKQSDDVENDPASEDETTRSPLKRTKRESSM